MLTTKKLDSLPAGNPFHHDLYRMGTTIGENVIVMFEKHSTEHQPYIIVVNTETGERVKVEFTENYRGFEMETTQRDLDMQKLHNEREYDSGFRDGLKGQSFLPLESSAYKTGWHEGATKRQKEMYL